MRLPTLPGFMQTIRFRLTVLYSSMLFGVAALVLGGIYTAVAISTENRELQVKPVEKIVQGRVLGTVPMVYLKEFENQVNLETMRTLRDYSLAALGGLFAASLGIGWVLSGRVLRPVRAITQTAAEIQATDLSRRIRLSGPKDELRDLADTVDTMLDRLEEAFRAQRQLIDDASHELRTPLAIIRANVDAVLTSPDSTEEERARAARISIGTEVPRDLYILADPVSVDVVVRNLVENALAAVAPVGGGTITLRARAANGEVELAVRDTGVGFRPADRARLFEKFTRLHPGGGSGSLGTGLGLFIVQRLMQLSGGRVSAHSEGVGRGAEFVLVWPRAATEPDVRTEPA